MSILSGWLYFFVEDATPLFWDDSLPISYLIKLLIISPVSHLFSQLLTLSAMIYTTLLKLLMIFSLLIPHTIASSFLSLIVSVGKLDRVFFYCISLFFSYLLLLLCRNYYLRQIIIASGGDVCRCAEHHRETFFCLKTVVLVTVCCGGGERDDWDGM